ncbi:4-hydroxythreonine-4-phosphate dehydrogenase [Roseivivax halodurans JCM 10272]|uniref:4-hydroxythreonine-4-phosphate dehydrogenase n=1 Tax=Roseivivax halodurans JCM 10272 TaxID=1449350 RepID=X7EFK6_9RHOB|nr:4-hydroxythreonine-4-phosphate dehydrogenase PdxA [Roseivivax halodurans]ETX14665.1 4-hydroxythreonine-4-phosphate dehydrogenase [Roseivivax halodurans JCM 10272]
MSPAPIALSCGEPAGIGPELAVAAREALGSSVAFAWIGDPDHLPEGTNCSVIDDIGDAADVAPDALPVLPLAFPGPRVPGTLQPMQAAKVVEAISIGASLASEARASALCTLPIHKKALAEGAGFAFPGHTEYLASLAGVDHVVMMLASEMLRVVPATIHIPIADVPRSLDTTLLDRTIRITHEGLRRHFGIDAPRMAVAGLNPHAGEGGKIGREDTEIIAPLLERLRNEGFKLSGPHSADTLFHAAARARYDAAICMYHDQALIPIKTLDFDRGVNVTLGLPFIRTSPDHGTALDIAGQGVANPSSTVEALKLAWRMAGGTV